MRILIWNEFHHERHHPQVAEIYPDGIHATIARALQNRLPAADIATATLDQPEHGLSIDRLDQTDVLFWWGHMAHDQVAENIVERVHRRVLDGMGLIVLHSGHASKIFIRLMGTGCMLRWREAAEKERVWVVDPTHPILAGLGMEYFEIPQSEMYGELFDVPPPDELLTISWFSGGEVFRSGCTYRRGRGKIFYFSPGHETYPIYHQPEISQILANAARWATPSDVPYHPEARHIETPLEPLS